MWFGDCCLRWPFEPFYQGMREVGGKGQCVEVYAEEFSIAAAVAAVRENPPQPRLIRGEKNRSPLDKGGEDSRPYVPGGRRQLNKARP